MNILTYFDAEKISDGWRQHVEHAFSMGKNVTITHLETIEEVVRHLELGRDAMIVFGFSDGKNGMWTSLIPYVKEWHIPVLITGDLEKKYYNALFLEKTGRVLEILDSVQFYPQSEEFKLRLPDQVFHGGAGHER